MRTNALDKILFTNTPSGKNSETFADYLEKRLLNGSSNVTPLLLTRETDKSIELFRKKGDDPLYIGEFPAAVGSVTLDRGFGYETETVSFDYFQELSAIYDSEGFDALPWGFKDIYSRLRKACGEVKPGFGDSRLGGFLKYFPFAILCAGLCLLSYWICDGGLGELLGDGSGTGLLGSLLLILGDTVLRFVGWFVMIGAGLGTLALTGAALLQLLTGGVSRSAIQALKAAYKDAVSFVRLRELWYRDATDKKVPPVFLLAAEDAIARAAAPCRRKLKDLWTFEAYTRETLARKTPVEKPEVKPDAPKKSPKCLIAEAALNKFMAERGLTSREDRASCALHLSINDRSNRLEYLELAAEAGCVNAAWAAAEEYLRMGCSPAVLKKAETLARQAVERGCRGAAVTLRNIWLRLAHVYEAQARKLYDSIMIDCLNDPNGAAGTWQEKAESLARQPPEMHELYRNAGIYHRLLADAGSSMSCWWMANLLGRHAASLYEARQACKWISQYRQSGHAEDIAALDFWCMGHMNNLGRELAEGGKLSAGREVFRLIAELGSPTGARNYMVSLVREEKFNEARTWLMLRRDKMDPELHSDLNSAIDVEEFKAKSKKK